MLRQIEPRLQNRPITKSGLLPVTPFFFEEEEEEEEEEFVLVLEPLKKSYVDVKTTQMSIFVFFVTAGV